MENKEKLKSSNIEQDDNNFFKNFYESPYGSNSGNTADPSIYIKLDFKEIRNIILPQ